MVWLLLAGTIVFEVAATVSLRLAVNENPWCLSVASGYLVSFALLADALAGGLPLGVAYGIWAAAGIALTAILGRIPFKDPCTWLMGLGASASPRAVSYSSNSAPDTDAEQHSPPWCYNLSTWRTVAPPNRTAGP